MARQRRGAGVLVSVMVVLALAAPAAVAAAISQSYRADEAIAIGALVTSKDDSGDVVELADIDNADNLVGAVVGGNDAALNLSNPGDQIQVASNGLTKVIVTDLQGEIQSGTQIAPSSIKGVGARATTATKIVGVAQKEAEYGDQTATVTDRNGQSRQARVGTAEVLLQIAYYTPPQGGQVNQFVQQVAQTVAGRNVATWRIITSFVIVMAAIIVITVILFSSVHSTIIAIGRNPLAQMRIYKGLLRVVGIVVVIFAVAVGAAYMVLRL